MKNRFNDQVKIYQNNYTNEQRINEQISLFEEIKKEEKVVDNDPMCKVLNMDCLEYMKNQKDSEFDVVFTSPPYNDSGNENDGQEQKGFRHRKYTFVENRQDWFDWQSQCIDQMMRISKKFVLYNVQPILNNKEDVYRLIGKYAEKIHMILIWYKPNAQPQHYEHRISNCYEMVIVFKGNDWNKKKFWLNTNGNRNVIVKNINSNRKYSKQHRAVMSIDFAEEIIKNYTEDNDTVFDPFSGIATTGVACIKNGRNYVGTELNEDYYKMSLQRLNETKKQMEEEKIWKTNSH